MLSTNRPLPFDDSWDTVTPTRQLRYVMVRYGVQWCLHSMVYGGHAILTQLLCNTYNLMNIMNECMLVSLKIFFMVNQYRMSDSYLCDACFPSSRSCSFPIFRIMFRSFSSPTKKYNKKLIIENRSAIPQFRAYYFCVSRLLI